MQIGTPVTDFGTESVSMPLTAKVHQERQSLLTQLIISLQLIRAFRALQAAVAVTAGCRPAVTTSLHIVSDPRGTDTAGDRRDEQECGGQNLTDNQTDCHCFLIQERDRSLATMVVMESWYVV